ncbi:hypothetical protein PU629_13830 [Pullulanibacillus sp. KACC 23026]|uniref:hypothetical protein n=1 Tax=Pullulanibacillus sp. KACC 23026 TaxID=3028315 RepID=UPI0023AE96C1|nr:hypothetical protein [Pullulanibacillus sp. KACC 23026]WEG11241.1 hypothetical protein PU629_13830 [Pullulanibacillus sp. KACC 23026]
MIHQKVTNNEQKNGRVYYFVDFQKKKPFFLRPVKMTVGDPLNHTYLLVKNVVFQEKQILALKNEQSPETIVLVEAHIEEGQLKYISKLSNEVMVNVSQLLMKTNSLDKTASWRDL